MNTGVNKGGLIFLFSFVVALLLGMFLGIARNARERQFDEFSDLVNELTRIEQSYETQHNSVQTNDELEILLVRAEERHVKIFPPRLQNLVVKVAIGELKESIKQAEYFNDLKVPTIAEMYLHEAEDLNKKLGNPYAEALATLKKKMTAE
jgi:hypothetical protein